MPKRWARAIIMFSAFSGGCCGNFDRSRGRLRGNDDILGGLIVWALVIVGGVILRIALGGLLVCIWAALGVAAPNSTDKPSTLIDPSGEMSIRGELVYYSVAPRILDSSRKLQPVRLVTRDGRTWIRAYRGVAREYHLAGQWVRVWGTLFTPTRRIPKLVQGPHIRVERFEPVGKSFPAAVTRGGVPPLKIVRTLNELSGPRRRWIAVQGVLERVGLFSGRSTTFATVRLQDGAVLTIPGISQEEADSDWRPLGGDDVTALVEMEIRTAQDMHILRTAGVCQGFVPRCGLVPGARLGPRLGNAEVRNPFKLTPGSRSRGGQNLVK